MIKTPLSTVIGGAFWTPGATVIGGNTPTFDQQIQKLFANGEQGFHYDPNDLSTMFQDAAGTVPVTGVGQPVGLMLDKSKGLALGGELIVNGSFAQDVSWWDANNTAILTWNDGMARFTRNDSSDSISQGFPTVVGKWYKVTVTAHPASSNNARVAVGSVNSITSSTNTIVLSFTNELALLFIATTEISYISLGSVADGAAIDFDNVSIKSLTGNHAYQATSASRPILQDAPKRIHFDAVDDKLITDLPAQLTGCTVIRSVPSVGTQILTGQTISTTYEDNTDHCGLIVINRALTPSETSAITSELNKRAGV